MEMESEMYEYEMDPRPAASPQSPTVMLDAREIETLSVLMRELRDLTMSRRSFTAASDLLRRLGAETESPRLVAVD